MAARNCVPPTSTAMNIPMDKSIAQIKTLDGPAI
jgi:hypothetical protein